jgi:hypothetical protein
VKELSAAELDALIAEATLDAYTEDEELTGFAITIGDNLAVPFETTLLGMTVTVKKINQTESGIVAICARASTGRPSRSSTSRCRTRPRKVPNGSRPIAAGLDRGRRA